MLWSLLKILIFVALVGALTFGAGYLIDTGGHTRLAIADWEFNLGPLQAVIADVVALMEPALLTHGAPYSSPPGNRVP